MLVENIEDLYELSPMQQGMLFHSLMTSHAGEYIEQMVYILQGNLDTAQFYAAWQRIVMRHPILRTTFHWEEIDKPLQMVHATVTIPLQELDWRDGDSEEQQRRLDAFLAADRVRGFAIAEPPLLRLTLLHIADDRYYFVWTYHHLLLDGWS